HGCAARISAFDGGRWSLGWRASVTARDHTPRRQQRTKVASSARRTDHRIRTDILRTESQLKEIFMPEVITAPQKGTSAPQGNIVEMNWDPITRIVGSLGIFTKINFDTKQVVECYSTSSIF